MDRTDPQVAGIKLAITEIYRLKEFELYSKLQDAIASKTKVGVVLDTPMLKAPHSNLDIADDYYMALILGELIAPFCADIDWDEVPGGYGVESIMFSLTPADVGGLAQKLAWYSQTRRQYLEPDDNNWTPVYPDGGEYENLLGFNEDMDANVKRFDDLAESYVRNLQVGIGEEYDGMELQNVYNELRVAYKRWWDPSLESRPLNIDMSQLSEGMTEEQVSEIFGGRFSYMYSQLVNGRRVLVVDYRVADTNENTCRLWFLDGGLVSWQTGDPASKEINLRSLDAPEFVKKLQNGNDMTP